MDFPLLDRRIEGRELIGKGRTHPVHDHNDRERNACGNQAVFDRGSAGLVLPKSNNAILHDALPAPTSPDVPPEFSHRNLPFKR